MTDIHKAYLFGKEKHKDHTDDLGEDYFENHCMKVMEIIKTA